MTPKQKAFVQEYLVDLNAAAAARRAGYSERTARIQAAQMAAKPDIAAAIQAAMTAREKRTGITADMVLRELAKIGFSDIRKAVKWGSRLVERPFDRVDQALDGVEMLEPQPHGGALRRPRKGDDDTDAFFVTSIELTDSADLDDDTAAAVSEIAQTKEGVRIKLHDKKGALVDIGRHLGMFTDKVEHSGSVRIAQVERVIVDPNPSNPNR